ncbi:uncharacterized protein K452DRAFT_271389 [Aplosporella prunicola CBS 121167]|uniref:C2 domain-containing protein n=1 Tax=Aplosporella prunicola CBS 121167 TaxID=1176127 RepID=A0A6A6BCC1_9PEZI|nr:uncharacterized protein K452DRAFT_271389 [Aplosporella prunicola CBS 121167]KAF2141706.1 hypothetical protein K452DRAFT_271389 [Aplosporella prunicola CBS 121167]
MSPDIPTADGQAQDPSAQPQPQQDGYAAAPSEEQQEEERKHREKRPSTSSSKHDEPAGGYDSTPIPHAPPGYTIKVTFHRATNLPMADISSLSSDPFVLCQINTDLRPRHKEDPPLRFRTPTRRRTTEPEWNSEWIIANVPASGFKLKARVYDEDARDHDDRLGNVHILVDRLYEGWPGVKEESYKLRKRAGSKRAYAAHAVFTCVNQSMHINGQLVVSIELLGKTQGEEGGRSYTIGPCWWTKHYSPLLGRLANRKDTGDDENPNLDNNGQRVSRYNFQANQMQLSGPVPEELYHRYVEFKPFVKGMFTSTGIRGFLLSKALHHQHSRVYNFDSSTEYGLFEQPSEDLTQKFLDLVHYDKGGRIFTYVLTLDALFRFTETGKEFGIDMLSKHTMHSDVSIYIAFSGEFFIRRLKHAHRKSPDENGNTRESTHNDTHPPTNMAGGPPDEEPPKDPAHYELVIDNDSGTYRPNAKLLPLLKRFLQQSFPGLKIATLDSQADAEKMDRLKQEQRDRKAEEGDQIVYTQPSDDESSISSSDEEDLDDAVAAHEARTRDTHVLNVLGHQAKGKQTAKMDHLKDFAHRPGARQDEGGEPSQAH